MRLTYVRGAQCPHPHTQILEGRPRRPLVGCFHGGWGDPRNCRGGRDPKIVEAGNTPAATSTSAWGPTGDW